MQWPGQATNMPADRFLIRIPVLQSPDPPLAKGVSARPACRRPGTPAEVPGAACKKVASGISAVGYNGARFDQGTTDMREGFAAPSLHTTCARLLMAVLWGMICLMVFAAPFLAAHSHSLLSSFVYLFFSPVCHQLPARSFAMLGHPWGVCQRCAGMYLGLFTASLFFPRFCFETRMFRGSRAADEIGTSRQFRLLFSCSRPRAFGVNGRFENSDAGIRRIWLAAGTVPILADALLPLSGFWTSTPPSRFLSGFAFGFLISALLVVGITELLREVPKSSRLRVLVNHGGES